MTEIKREPYLSYSDLSRATYYWIDNYNKLQVFGEFAPGSYPFHDPNFSAATPLVFENRRALKRFIAQQKHISTYHRAVIESASIMPWEPSVLVITNLLRQHCGYDVESTSSARGMALSVLGVESNNPYESMKMLMDWMTHSFALDFAKDDDRFFTPAPKNRSLRDEIYSSAKVITKRAWLDRMLKPQISSIGHSSNLRITEDNISDWDQIRQLHRMSRMEVSKEGTSALLETLPYGAYKILNQPRTLAEGMTFICVVNDTDYSMRTTIENKRLNSDDLVEVRLSDALPCRVGDLVIAAPILLHFFTKPKSTNEDSAVDAVIPVTPKIRLLLTARKNNK